MRIINFFIQTLNFWFVNTGWLHSCTAWQAHELAGFQFIFIILLLFIAPEKQHVYFQIEIEFFP